MKIEIRLDQVLVDMYNTPLERDNKGNHLTMKDVIMQTLLTPDPVEQGKEVKPARKFSKYALFEKVKSKTTSIVLDMDEVKEIKDMIGEVKPELIMGQAWAILEDGVQVKTSAPKK